MATPNNWTAPQTMGDWMRAQEKRMMREERRPRVSSAVELLGPGFGPAATQVTDWNSETAQFNGFFYSLGDAANVPASGVESWLGLAVSSRNRVVQIVWSHETPTHTYVRTIEVNEFATATFSVWQEMVGGGGGDTGGATYLADLLDVDTVGQASGDLLRYTGSGWVPSKTLPGHAHTITDLPVADSGEVSAVELVRANDSRLSDARTPTSHAHPLADLPVADSGEVSSTELVRADDLRLSNARTPLSHTHVKAQITDFAHTHALDDLTAGTLSPPLVMAGQSSVPAAPAAGTGVLFVRNNKPYFRAPTGAEVDLTNVPTVVSDHIAASGTITLTPIGGIGSLFFRWTEATSADPVTYRLYVRAGAAPTIINDDYLVAQGSELRFASVRTVEGVPVDPSGRTIYYAMVTGADIDTNPGQEVLSSVEQVVPAQVTGPDIAVGAITADLMTANEAFIEALQATNFTGVTVTGATVQTGTDVQNTGGIRLTSGLLEAFAGGGKASFFSVNPAAGIAMVAGTINSLYLTVSGIGATSSLGGATNFPVNGVATLASGSTAPTAGPTVSYDYQGLQFGPVDAQMSQRKGWVTDGTAWYTYLPSSSGTSRIERYDASGVRTHGIDAEYSAKSTGLAYVGGFLYRIATATTDGSSGWRLYRYSFTAGALVQGGSLVLQTQGWASGLSGPALGVNSPSTDLLLYGILSNGRIRIRRIDTNWSLQATSPLYEDTDSTYPVSSGYVTYDGAYGGNADYGAYRVTIPMKVSTGVISIRPFTMPTGFATASSSTAGTTASRQSDEEWNSGSSSLIGFAYSGSSFRSVDNTGYQRTYTGLWTKQPSSYEPVYVSSTLAYSSNPDPTTAPLYQTTQSPKTLVFNGSAGGGYFPKRARLLINAPTLPARSGAQDPDRVRIFLNRAGSTVTYDSGTQTYLVGSAPGNQAGTVTVSNAMVLAAAPAPGGLSAQLTAWPSSTTQPPTTSSGFPGQTAAKLQATDGGFSVDGSSNGDIGTGTLRNSVDARVSAVLPSLVGASRRVIGKSATQVITTATGALLTWNTTHASTGPDVPTYVSGGTVITIPVAGVWVINFAIQWATGTAGTNFAATLVIGGLARASHVAQFSASSNARATQNYGTWTGYLAAASQVSLDGFHHHGSDLAAQPGYAISAANPGTFIEFTKIA